MDSEVSVKPVQDGVYTRTIEKHRDNLQKTLCKRYSINNIQSLSCFIYSSGMNAIYSILQCEAARLLFSNKDHNIFLVGDEFYCDTKKVLNYLECYDRIQTVVINMSDDAEVIAAFQKHGHSIKVIFFESCSNPSGKVVNWDHIKSIRDQFSPQCRIIIDNTWLSSALFNPFQYGADFVVLSLTKYYSGSNCIMGAVLGITSNMNYVIKFSQISGVHVDARSCKMVNEAITDMDNRVVKAGTLALMIAQWLETCDKVTEVMYPMLDSHPNHNNTKYLKNSGPGCLLFHVPIVKKKFPQWTWVNKWVEQSDLAHIRYETSFGDEHSKIDCWPRRGLSKTNVDGTWIRLSLGYNTIYDEIISDLTKLFENLPANANLN